MLADTALSAATKAGASYCDVRIGRYLNQYVITRDLNVENVVNTESAGVGVRVICNGAYGFAATNDMTPDGVAGAARQAVAIAKANAKLQSEPVQLAPVKGVGEVSWATPVCQGLAHGADQGKGRAADRRQQGRHGRRRQLHAVDAVPGEPAEVLRVHRRLLHRPGHPAPVGAVDRHRGRQGDRQVPFAPGPVGAGRHGLRIPGRAQGSTRSRPPAASPRCTPNPTT
jgi:hypothetical protein